MAMAAKYNQLPRPDLVAPATNVATPYYKRPEFVAFQVVVMFLYAVFLFGLPFWSWFLNDKLGLIDDVCDTPAEQLMCGSGRTATPYLPVAQRLGRKNAAGQYIGCECEDGILQDWACPVGQPNFSVSYFISATPGTGAMGGFASFGIVFMWLSGAGSVESITDALPVSLSPQELQTKAEWIRVSLIAFQVFFALFLFNTLCIFPHLHFTVVSIFIISISVHFLSILFVVDFTTIKGKCIAVVLAVSLTSVGIGYFYPVGDSWFSLHAFYLGECVGLVGAFSLSPLLLVLGEETGRAGQLRAQGTAAPRLVTTH